jgi:putative phosphoribosyl transferase
LFKDREEAGGLLAEAMSFLIAEKQDVLVLAIPRGGVPIAKKLADSLDAPLDVIITRKIGAPGNSELAVGAVTHDGEMITDLELVRTLGVSDGYLHREAIRQADEIERRMKEYRGDRPYPNLSGKVVVLVDDGIATGSTMQAAIQSVKRRGASRVIVAAPVAPADTIAKLSLVADRVVCLRTPEPFYAIGQFYREFEQVEDGEVREILGFTSFAD